MGTTRPPKLVGRPRRVAAPPLRDVETSEREWGPRPARPGPVPARASRAKRSLPEGPGSPAKDLSPGYGLAGDRADRSRSAGRLGIGKPAPEGGPEGSGEARRGPRPGHHGIESVSCIGKLERLRVSLESESRR
jgi:hypothetical protein